MQMRAPGEGSAGCARKTCVSEETCSLTDGRGRMAREQRCLWRCTGGVPARLSQRVLCACRRRARDSASLQCINLLSVEYNESMYRSRLAGHAPHARAAHDAASECSSLPIMLRS